ncbi:MAG TPA: lytic transglycosylase domain-containing protein [Plasticicumulans sp.]|uniref:lytic transglycosylase domain-containing protein n=1 Tax=Plasticicumulans sp. TaxID=2307179 RepID=UPI000F98B159|nr:lytic transglycosylase domain-containing protein [Plasticicumulans sp.]RTK97932.1 MAG: lytic transglycosylase domain-containing protein [Xanthomonadales bacterium]HMV40833.1 lytic transglycosylase domain-containing protein [Plasticicumulans sp.]HMW31411.1 lytic transglycosylase domain-containing protein [Plasticicumulans sp.]HMW44244.1 lytic transglycosylase domain-containing protein [Plasticicumulans sp.]HMX54541.1 lytic transglycosylase domain-containing protein [Plasticicumulans sp.]
MHPFPRTDREVPVGIRQTVSQHPRQPLGTAILKSLAVFGLPCCLALSLVLAPARTHAAEDEAVRSRPLVSSLLDDDGSERLYGTRIQKLADYIEENFAVDEAKAYSIVTHAIEHGTKNGLKPELLLAVIAVESTFKEDAVSSQGARGLMQVMPRFHEDAIREIGGAHALFKPGPNIRTGTGILVEYLDRANGDLHKALARYNGSSGKRSKVYANKVLSMYRKFQLASS